jgi:diguanylate cyclase (GGDEF)-like protein
VAHAAEALADLGFVVDKQAALEAVNARLAVLGIGSDETASIVDRINDLVSEFAELLGLRVETRLSYPELIAIASTGLADLNLSYEAMNRKLHESLAQQQHMAAELERLNRELDRQARTDSLSGLPNRRAFDEALLRELAVAQRQNAPLSVVILDIDHFKRINDMRGHLAGDHVLSEIGRLLRERVRLSDLAARFGGEEFALILPFTAEDGALIAAERFRKAIEGLAIDRDGAPLRVTASLARPAAAGKR